MTTKFDLIGEKQTFLTNTQFLNEDKVKFPQIKQNTIRQQDEKRQCKCVHTHEA